MKFNGEVTTAEIGNDTTIRECVTVNRGTSSRGKTTVGNNCMLMAYSHIGHDCVVKDSVIVGNASQIAGEVEIDDYAVVSGGSLIHQFVRISKNVMIQGGTRTSQDIPPYTLVGREPVAYCGINIVGLRRCGFSNEVISQIKEIYRIIYAQNLNITDAIRRIEQEFEASEERNLILNFVKSSKRGIVKSLMQK